MKISSGKILSLGAIAVVVVALGASFLTPPASAQLGSKELVNPPEIRSDPAKKRLREGPLALRLPYELWAH